MLALLIWLVIAILVLSFAVWAVRSFCPPEFQKYAFLLIGLVVLISVCYLLAGLAGSPPLGLHGASLR